MTEQPSGGTAWPVPAPSVPATLALEYMGPRDAMGRTVVADGLSGGGDLRIGNRVEFHGMARRDAQYNGLLGTVRCVLDGERFGVEHAGRILSISSQNLRFWDKGTAVDDTKTWHDQRGNTAADQTAMELYMQQKKRLTNEKARNERYKQQEAQLEEWFGRWWGCETAHVEQAAGKEDSVDADKACAVVASPSEPEETKTVDRQNTQKKEPQQQDKKKREQQDADKACTSIAPPSESAETMTDDQLNKQRKQQKEDKKRQQQARKKWKAQQQGKKKQGLITVCRIWAGAVLRASLRCLLLLSCYTASIVGLAPAVKTGFATVALPSMQAASSETLTPATPRLELALTGSPCVASSPQSLHHALAPNFPSPGTSRVPKGKAPSNYTLGNLNISIAINVSGNPQCFRVQEAIDARNGKGKALRLMNHARDSDTESAKTSFQDPTIDKVITHMLKVDKATVSIETENVTARIPVTCPPHPEALASVINQIPWTNKKGAEGGDRRRVLDWRGLLRALLAIVAGLGVAAVVHQQQARRSSVRAHAAGGDWRGLLRDVWAQGVANVSANCSALLGTVRAWGAALVHVDWRGLLSAVWAWGVALVLALLPQSLCPVQGRKRASGDSGAQGHTEPRKRGVSRSRGPAAARALVALAVLLLAVRGAHGAECSPGSGASLPCTFGGSGGCNFFLDADEFLDRTGSCPAQGGYLYLNNKNIKGLKPDVFDNMGAVRILYLHGNAISALPVGVFDQLTSLRILWLHGNAISALPVGVFDQLTSLTVLRLRCGPSWPYDYCAAERDNPALTCTPLTQARIAALDDYYGPADTCECPPGFIDGTDPYGFCFSCPSGTFNSNAGCASCPAGTFSVTTEITEIKVGSRVVLQDGYAQVGDAGRGPLKPRVGSATETATMTCGGSCGGGCAPTSGTASGTFSDGSGHGINYDNNEDCWWLIAAPGAYISVSFSSFRTESGNDYVRISRCDTAACETDSSERIASLSGSSVSSSDADEYSSSTGFLKVTFTSDSSGTYSGFTGAWSIRNSPESMGTVVEISGQDFNNSNVCPFSNDGACDDPSHTNFRGTIFRGTMTCGGSCSAGCSPVSGAVSGTFSDGSGDYGNNEDCWWLIAAQGADISVSFSSFVTESGGDYVRISRCDTAACEAGSTERIASLSGSSVSSSDEYSSSTGFLKVTFTSDSSGTYSGFTGTWSIVPRGSNICFNGTDTADCEKAKVADSGSEFSAAGRRLSDASLVVLLGAASEVCQITHTNARAERFSSLLFAVTLFSYFQTGSPSEEARRAFLEDGGRGTNMSSTVRVHRRSAASYKVETSGGAVWWYQEEAIMLQNPKVGATACTDCVAGKYGQTEGASDCLDCAAGKYSPTQAASTESACTDCAAGTYAQAAGASACTNCGCPAGQAQNGVCGGDSPGACETCPACPPGENRIGCVGSAAGTCVVCDTGCVACDAGKYKTTFSGITACQPCEAAPACPSGSYRAGCGGATEGACTDCGGCAAGEYRIECVSLSPGRCTACALGSYKTGAGSEACSTCGPGCAAGKHQSGCSSTSGTPQCSDCTAAPGSYCEAGSSYGSSAAGTACPLGYFCRGGAQDKQLCAAGTYSEAAASTCVACGRGKYSDSEGESTCQECAPGKYLDTEGNDAESECVSCGAGMFSTTPGAISIDTCQTCGAGKYASTTVNNKEGDCVACGSGKYSTSEGATSESTCDECPANSASPAASSALSDCRCNSGSTGPDGGACTLCVAGKFKATSGSALCTACEAGRYSASVGATSDVCQQCDPGCEAGEYQSSCAASSGLLECTNCSAVPGYYCAAGSSYGSSAAGTTCPLGYFCLGGAQDKQLCTVAAGRYCPPATVSAEGAVCPAGFWCAGGANDKTACAGGTYSATDGSASVAACSDCTVGTFSSEGSSGCTKCAPGTIVPALGAASCDKCEPGKYAVSAGSVSCTSCPTGKTSVAGSVSETDCNLDSDSTVTLTLTETVTMVVSLPMTRAEFGDEKQQAFKEAVAKAAGHGVRADHVLIDTIEEITAARRLLAQDIRVTVSVNAPDKDAAAAITASLTAAAINTELEKAGLPAATLLEAAVVEKGGEEATLASEATLLMGPVTTVGVTCAISIVFAVVTAWVVKDSQPFRDKKARTLYLLDFLDTVFDWGSWTGTNLEGDLTFSNDQDGIVRWTLCAISIFGTVLFLMSTISMCRFSRRSKWIIVLQLGFENFAQGILYIIVASSQASGSGNTHVSVIIGIIQALCFCGFQIFELNDLAADRVDVVVGESATTTTNVVVGA